MGKKKFYAIKNGRKTGVFTGQWKEVQKKYITGFPNPIYKGFNDRKEAEEYLKEPMKVKAKVKENNVQKKINPNPAVSKIAEKKLQIELIKEQIIYSEEVPNHKAMRIVSIAVIGHQMFKLENKPSYYECVLIDKESGKYIKQKSELMDNTSSNRAMIYALIDGISKLKYPCHIKFHTKASVGIEKMIRDKKSPNSEALKNLKELLIKNHHVIEEVINPVKVDKLFSQYR